MRELIKSNEGLQRVREFIRMGRIDDAKEETDRLAKQKTGDGGFAVRHGACVFHDRVRQTGISQNG